MASSRLSRRPSWWSGGGGLASSGKADADVTSGRCDPTERQEREFPRSSQSPGEGIDRDPNTPGIQCGDYLYDMDGPPRRSVPVVPRPVPEPRPEQAVEHAGGPTATPVAPGPRVWWNGVFMDIDEFLCFQDRAKNPFVDTLESTGCANDD